MSPDSGFVDYVRRIQGQLFELWRVPFLGGPARRLLEGVNSPIGWSPDGRHFAFIRVDVPRSATAVVVADANGAVSACCREAASGTVRVADDRDSTEHCAGLVT